MDQLCGVATEEGMGSKSSCVAFHAPCVFLLLEEFSSEYIFSIATEFNVSKAVFASTSFSCS